MAYRKAGQKKRYRVQGVVWFLISVRPWTLDLEPFTLTLFNQFAISFVELRNTYFTAIHNDDRTLIYVSS